MKKSASEGEIPGFEVAVSSGAIKGVREENGTSNQSVGYGRIHSKKSAGEGGGGAKRSS